MADEPTAATSSGEPVAEAEAVEDVKAPEPATGPVLASFAHPDDMEIGAGGTLAKWAAADRDVHLLILTNGDRGSQDKARDRAELARIRFKEQEAAAAVLGLSSFRILPTHDGELENSHEARVAIARVIRETRPATVVTCDPTAWFLGNRYFNHRDHRQAGETTLDALFPGAGNPLFFGELLDEGLEAWDVPQVYLCWSNEPNTQEDITGFMDRKLAALAEHRSQFDDDALASFDRWLREDALKAGNKIGVEHAESFRMLQLD
jgi:LmbE family N-acetylglucosaminyl deacetylase